MKSIVKSMFVVIEESKKTVEDLINLKRSYETFKGNNTRQQEIEDCLWNTIKTLKDKLSEFLREINNDK